jgi:hypothetical protein
MRALRRPSALILLGANPIRLIGVVAEAKAETRP